MRLLLLTVFLVSTVFADYADYTGFEVLRLTPSNKDQYEILQKLSGRYDIWHEAKGVGDYVDILIDPDNKDDIKTQMKEHGIVHSVMISDVGDMVQSQFRKYKKRDSNTALDFYRTLQEVEDWMDDMASAFPDLLSVYQIATSYEGRPIRIMKISSGGSNKPAFWMDSGIHSREWVAISTNIYYADALLNGYGQDPEITELINRMDFYIVPVFNVDGYDYTWTTDRLWRKTRSPNQGSACFGTDPNRNFDVMWGEVAAGGPCTQTFPGSGPFSEVEVRDVTAYMETIPNLVGALAIHSYGQMYMVSYGYTIQPNPDYNDQMEVCNEAIDALSAVHGEVYRCDSLINLVGPNSGSSADYIYEVMGIKYAFGVELRDTGRYGFLLPEEQIIPTAEENWEAVKVIAKAALSEA